ncbi:MAG: hypothetical protein GXO93_07160 [FCB group bacterium]|nr:hypothetical protein [FCB group bacterium]
MNCKQCQNQLLLYFGQKELPEDLQKHLLECDSCKKYKEDIDALAEKSGSDQNFYPDDATVEQMVNSIDETINNLEHGKITTTKNIWHSYIPTAAAVILFIGLSLIGYLYVLKGNNHQQATINNSDSLIVQTENKDLSTEDLPFLLLEFTSENKENANDLLIDNMTDEDLKYLEKNFNVGEIL